MNKKLIRIVAAALLLGAAYMLTHTVSMPVYWQLAVYLVPYLVAGYDVLAEAVEGIMEGDPFDEDFLMAVATIGALCIGFLPGAEPQFAEAVFVMLFFQVGEMFEDYAEDRSRSSIAELMDLRPDTAHVERGDKTVDLSPEQVETGAVIVVKAGEKVPLDGTVVEGHSSLNTVALTGESMPRSVGEGDEVLSGCINLSGLLKVKTSKSYGESTAARIIQLVEESTENKSKSETFIRRFAHVYTPAVVVLALIVAFVPPFFYADYASAFSLWLYRALTFLVVSCPCALVVSVPLTFFAGIGGASSKGILIKGGNFMDVLARVRTVVFDKTGTLTQGQFAVDTVHPETMDRQQLLHLAAHAERYSTHPIAAALRNSYPDEHDACTVGDVRELSGRGISTTVNGQQVCVGSKSFLAGMDIETTPCDTCEQQGGTMVHVAVDGRYAGHISITDQVKPDAADAVSQLKHLGVERIVMLTGDRKEVGSRVAAALGIDEVHSELLPADKVERMKDMIARRKAETSVAFVGDGINDAPVLALADVGVAMGGLGSDAAIEAADVVLMNDRPSMMAQAISIARRTIGIARQNMWFAISVKVAILIAVTLGLLGSWAMGVAVFGDVGVMVLAVLNAMRALRV